MKKRRFLHGPFAPPAPVSFSLPHDQSVAFARRRITAQDLGFESRFFLQGPIEDVLACPFVFLIKGIFLSVFVVLLVYFPFRCKMVTLLRGSDTRRPPSFFRLPFVLSRKVGLTHLSSPMCSPSIQYPFRLLSFVFSSFPRALECPFFLVAGSFSVAEVSLSLSRGSFVARPSRLRDTVECELWCFFFFTEIYCVLLYFSIPHSPFHLCFSAGIFL